jgi:pyridinium-3,5-bisthiocarboxylic acid mononucleotide nickel chelatase
MTLFYDCFAGISGDMNLAALIDLGVDPNYLKSELKKLGIDGYEIKISNDSRRGIFGTRVDVIIEEKPHSVLFVQQHSHQHHENRSFGEIKQIIEKSALSDFVKTKSIAIFKKLAEAEGKIHNQPIEKVHFHEVGAVDSIVDIVGAAICIDFLKPSKIIASRIELGSGMVKCAHGLFPVPAPATAEVLKGIPVKTGTVSFEATTPTGAAILAVIADSFVEKLNLNIEKAAYGIGHKDSEIPNVLRVYQCTDEQTSGFIQEQATVIECNIDDMNPEVYETLMEKLFQQGALDVTITQIIMKKSRPAITLSVICKNEQVQVLTKTILTETSSIGVRVFEVNRFILNREIIEIETSLGNVKVKKAWAGDIIKYKPEYEDCSRIAKEKSLPLVTVFAKVQNEINQKFA